MPKKYEPKITEAPSNFSDLDKMSISNILTSINQEDGQIHLAVKKVIPQIENFVSVLVQKIKDGDRLFYLGAGTSGRLGVLDAAELPPTFGVSDDIVIGLIAGGEKALRHAVESAEDDPEKAWKELLEFNIGKQDTVMGIAASGTTPYVVGGLQKARNNGISTACITCNTNTPLSLASDIAIEVIVGPEFVTGSTRLKAGTAQKMILNMITTTLMIQLGRVKGSKMINMQLKNNKLIERGIKMLMDELNLNQEEAKTLLFQHKSVAQAIKNHQKK